MKIFSIFFLLFLGFAFQTNAQCDTSQISNTGWAFISVNSTDPGGTGAEAIDGDLSSIWQKDPDSRTSRKQTHRL